MPGWVGPGEIIILLIVALLVFGPKKLPEMGRSIGKGMREFKSSISGSDDDDDEVTPELPEETRSGAEDRHHVTMRRVVPRRLAPGEEAPLVDHLGELRARLVWCLVAVGLAFILTFTFNDKILGWLNRPLDPGVKPTTFAVAEPFMTTFMIAFWAAVAIALPVILWQLWSFLAPAIHEHTQRTVLGFVGFATVLFLGGLFFAYFVALPASIDFLTNFNSDDFDIQLRAQDYYTFVLWVLIALSVVFELPIFILALARLGIVPSSKLRRNRRIGYVAVTALAVAMPGVDPVTLLFTMIPLLLLFEMSIWMAVYFDRKWQRAADAREAAFEAGADV